MNGGRIINLILLIIGIGILIFFLSTVDLISVKEGIETAGPNILFVLIVLLLINISIKAYRWIILVRKTTNTSIRFGFSFLSIFAGVSSGSLLPGRNEATKPLLLKYHYKLPFSKTMPTAFMEKAFDFIALIVLFLIALAYIPGKSTLSVYFLPVIIVGILLVLGFLIFPKHLSKIGILIIDKLPLPRKHKKILTSFSKIFFATFDILKGRSAITLFVLSFISMLSEALRIFYLFLAFGMAVSFTTASVAFTGSLIAGILTLIPGGIGVTETSASLLLASLTSYEISSITPLVLIDRVIVYYLVVAVGSLVAIFHKRLLR